MGFLISLFFLLLAASVEPAVATDPCPKGKVWAVRGYYNQKFSYYSGGQSANIATLGVRCDFGSLDFSIKTKLSMRIECHYDNGASFSITPRFWRATFDPDGFEMPLRLSGGANAQEYLLEFGCFPVSDVLAAATRK